MESEAVKSAEGVGALFGRRSRFVSRCSSVPREDGFGGGKDNLGAGGCFIAVSSPRPGFPQRNGLGRTEGLPTSDDLTLNREPHELPVTLETWRRLPNELPCFYLERNAPTELAARVMLNDSLRRVDLLAPVSCQKARDLRSVLTKGRDEAMPGRKARAFLGRRIPPCRAGQERLQTFSGLPLPFESAV